MSGLDDGYGLQQDLSADSYAQPSHQQGAYARHSVPQQAYYDQRQQQMAMQQHRMQMMHGERFSHTIQIHYITRIMKSTHAGMPQQPGMSHYSQPPMGQMPSAGDEKKKKPRQRMPKEKTPKTPTTPSYPMAHGYPNTSQYPGIASKRI